MGALGLHGNLGGETMSALDLAALADNDVEDALDAFDELDALEELDISTFDDT
jgi:hypothetical protein